MLKKLSLYLACSAIAAFAIASSTAVFAEEICRMNTVLVKDGFFEAYDGDPNPWPRTTVFRDTFEISFTQYSDQKIGVEIYNIKEDSSVSAVYEGDSLTRAIVYKNMDQHIGIRSNTEIDHMNKIELRSFNPETLEMRKKDLIFNGEDWTVDPP